MSSPQPRGQPGSPARADAGKFRKKYKQVLRNLTEEQKINKKLGVTLQQKKSALLKMRGDLQKANAELIELKTKHGFAQKNLDKLEREHEKTRTRLAEVRAEHEEVQVLLDQQRKQETIARSTVTKLSQQRNAIEARTGVQQSKYNKVHEEKKRIDQEIQGLRRRYDLARRSLVALESELELFGRALDSDSD